MHIFFSNQIFENQIVLTGDEFNHCKNVLRLKVGEEVNVTEGKGKLYLAKIESFTKEKAVLSSINLISEEYKNRRYSLEVVIAPTKNSDRIEWFVEKAVEIGIDEISFINTKRSERKVVNIDRLDKIAIAAMKQSGKSWLPVINEIQSFEKKIKHEVKNCRKFIAHLVENEVRNDLRLDIQNVMQKSTSEEQMNFQILIGPEGDFSQDEVKLALENSYLPVSLGPFRLRTETAGVMACATFAIILN